MEGLEFVCTSGTAAGMQFESDSRIVMFLDFRKIGWRFRERKLRQTPIAFTATPMVFAVHSKDCVAKSKSCFGQIATDEIGVVTRVGRLSKLFADQQKAAATVEEQPGGFGKRYGRGVKMMLTMLK